MVSESAAAKVARMMEAVVGKDGLAPMANINGYRVAGKTGTAQAVDPDCGCYDGGKVVSFAGFAPADDPRFVVYVVVKDPRKGAGGGSTGGPVFHDLMAAALQKYGVPPTGARATRVPGLLVDVDSLDDVAHLRTPASGSDRRTTQASRWPTSPTPGCDVVGVRADVAGHRAHAELGGRPPGRPVCGAPGARTHGARFAADAVERGAVAVLTDAGRCRAAGRRRRAGAGGRRARARCSVAGRADLRPTRPTRSR